MEKELEDHYFFIDESGSKIWESPYRREFVESPPLRDSTNINFWRKNYFVLAGIHISSKKIAELNPVLNDLKKHFFGTKYVEIKSDWLRNPFQRKKRYLDVFEISEENLRDFTEEWYKILFDHSKTVQIQAFVLDKRFYKKRKYSPLQILTQVLFDRIEMHSAEKSFIVFDQMESHIHSEKSDQGTILKISNREINLGSLQNRYTHVRPKFEKSKNSNFIQLADTVAYNVWRQFVNHGDWWDEEMEKGLKMYSYFQRIIPNFYHKNGQISGIGIIKVPDLTKRQWGKD
jgi:hypothetical protein